METLTQPSVGLAHREQVNRLKFFRDELDIMRKRLSEIVKKNSSSDILSMVDHFENQILIHEKVIVDLKHKIKSSAKNFEILMSVNTGSEEVISERENELAEKVKVFDGTYEELRNDYINFLSRNI